MRFYIGKGLELAGIVITGYSLWTGMVLRSERLYILFFGIGVGVFLAGWLLERKARG